MQNVSENYLTILSGLYDVESKLEVYTRDGSQLVATFDGDEIVSLSTHRKLFTENHPSIGGAVANEIDASFYVSDAEIPKMAMLKPWSRLTNGETVSEWVQKGVFWIDTRKKDYETGVLTIHGFDGILQLERMNTLNSTSSATLLNHICTTLGFQLDNRTQAASVTISNPTYYTFREIMQMIAAVSAGNWIMTDLGELLLVPLNGMPTETYVLVDNIGNAITFGGDRILTEVV